MAECLALERINRLLDEGSFVEVGALVSARTTDFTVNDQSAPSDGVITGYGQIEGNPVYVYSQNRDVLNGTMGEMHAKKIAKVGAGLASAMITGLLSSSGYVSSSAGITAQPETALEMIVSLYKFGPILIAAVIIVTLFGYKLDKIYPAIMQELTEREAHGQL